MSGSACGGIAQRLVPTSRAMVVLAPDLTDEKWTHGIRFDISAVAVFLMTGKKKHQYVKISAQVVEINPEGPTIARHTT